MKTPRISSRTRTALLAAVLLAAALGALALWGRSESALRWVAGQASAWSGGRVVLEGVSGSVLGPLRAARLTWRSPDAEVTVEGLEADWSPARLVLGRALRVTRLQADRVEVVVKPSDTPLEPPQDLTPPLPLVLARVALPRIELRGLGPELLAQDLNGSLEADAKGYRLDISSLRFPRVSLSGGATLAAARPFAMEGELNAKAAYADQTFSIPVRLSGTLEAAGLSASLDHPWAKGLGAATLAPFGEQPLRELRAEFSGMDPARHGKGLPSAQITAILTAAAARRGLAGRLEVVNRAPGRLDQGRLPLERAESRVALAGGELRFEELVIALAGAGTLEGAGRADSAQAELTLRTAGLALNALHVSLKPLRPAGTLALKATREQQSALADLASGDYRLQLDVLHRDALVTLRSAALRARGSELEAAGELRLDGARSFAARGALKAFNPAQWGNFPKARLNARLEAEGQLEPAPQGTLRYRVVDSQYVGAPLSGEGVLGYAGKQALRADGHLALGDNRVSFRGGLGPGERLAWSLDAASLSALGAEFSGKGTASGWFAGTLDHPSFQFDLRAQGLRLPGGLAAGTLQSSGEFSPGAEGVLRGRLEAQKAQLAGYALDSLQAAADGTPPRHTLSVAAKNSELDFQAGAEGGLSAGPRWSGRLLSLVTRKPVAGSLASPAAITIARDELEIGAADISVGDARLALERLAWHDGRLASRGRFTALPLALLARSRPEAPWQSNLSFSGAWDLDLGAALNGELRVAREGGDIGLGAGKPLPLGLTQALLEARARDSVVEVSAAAEGERLGRLRATFSSRIEPGEGGWRLAAEAPLSGALQGRVPSLAWLGPLLDPILATAGALEINARASGTVGDPVLEGQITGQGLEAHADPTGLHLTRGTLAADFTGDRLLVREFTLHGGQGTLRTSGSVSFAGARREGVLDFTLERLAIVDMPGQKLEVSGGGKLAVDGARITLSGDIRADQGLIELKEWDRPRLSDDVVVAGRERATPAGGGAPGLRLALDLDLGDRFRVKGPGLDARLAGAIQVRSDDGPTKAKGVVRVAEGSYSAYGQRLQIERGALMFDGQITNPALDIVALRKNQRVEAGVAITGTVLSPRTRLVSVPPVPDAEKLSWLVLGQGTGARDDSALSLPAVGATAKDSQYVSVGAQITSSLHIGVGRSITGTGTLLKLTYILSDRWSVQTRSGDASGGSVFYTISFE